MGEEKGLLRCTVGTDAVFNALKTHMKYAHSVRVRPTLKDVERSRNGLAREPYKRPLYERTLMSKPLFKR